MHWLIIDETNTEPDPSTVVQNFVSTQQDQFTTQLAEADGAPSNVQTGNCKNWDLLSEVTKIQ